MRHRMNRRRMLKLAAGAIASAALGPVAFAERKRPNMLFMCIDDLNDWIGCLGGHPDVKTPHMDALASRGVLFSNAHCAAPACNPSRAALMTGIRPSTSGVYINSQPWRKSPVLRDAVTIPQHFMAHGYEVIGSGKIFHGGYPDPASWQTYWPSQRKNKPDDPERIEKSPAARAHFDWGPLDVPVEQMGDWQVADWVIGQLEEQHDKPFFLGCGFFKPHLPWHVPRKYFDMYPADKITLPNVKEDDLDDVPPIGRQMALKEGDHARVMEHNEWRNAVQAYLACISFVDECVGRVIDALERSPHRDNTIVILWSDHGWHLGEKLHWRKFALWEEATHNVLMFVAPGVTKAGGRCERTVNLLDVYPTLIDLCDLEHKKELEGKSLAGLLKRPNRKWKRPALTTHERGNHSVRSDRWRYIRYKDGTEELYDHSVDEMEWTNLATDPKYAPVKKELQKWLPKTNADDAPSAEQGKRGREEA